MKGDFVVKLLLTIISWKCGNIRNRTVMASTNCPTGWFDSPECKLKCYCPGSVQCNDNGECGDPLVCDEKHFGPACQYVDLAVTQGVAANEGYISDHNEKTCNPNNKTTEAVIKLKAAFAVLWFRIYIKQFNLRHAFSISYDADQFEDCKNETRFEGQEPNFTDVFCTFNKTTQVFNIYGEGVKHLCSVYISGGRNLVLKAKMSTNEENLLVDGVTDQSSPRNACLPIVIDTKATWKTTFTGFVAQSVSIYVGDASGIYVDLVVILVSPNNRKHPVSKVTYTNKGIYHLPVSPIFVNAIEVEASTKGQKTQISVCEVELYGEQNCLYKQYGFDCLRECSSCQKSCSPVSGVCSPDCPMYKYGTNCAHSCNESCLNQRCMAATGGCYNCRIGFSGPSCNTACTDEKWGVDCANLCPMDNCGKEICNSFTGYCMACSEGRVGRNCEECQKGTYGDKCSLKCPDHCQFCDILNGSCLQCEGARFGSKCSECPPKFFGSKCMSSCSANCLDGTCNKDTGNCLPCKPGYQGPKCLSGSFDKLPLYILAPLALLFTFVAVVLLFCVQRALRRHSVAEQTGTS